MTDSKVSKAANLARIRDNQRRSRARRKEYLQELEAKLRQCEQMGVEASAEIQSAARKVLDENKRLRAMLRTRGVPEAEIAAALGANDKSFEYTSAAPALMSALERKWTRNVPASNDTPNAIQPMASSTSAPSTTVLTPISIPSQPSIARTTSETNSPHSTISSTGTPPRLSIAPFFPMDMTPVPEIKTEDVQSFTYQFDANTTNPWMYSTSQSLVPHAAGYYNTTSCVDAANIIRTMRTDVGTELEVDLGCRTPEQDCRVPNPLVLNVMDKYQYSGIRM